MLKNIVRWFIFYSKNVLLLPSNDVKSYNIANYCMNVLLRGEEGYNIAMMK